MRHRRITIGALAALASLALAACGSSSSSSSASAPSPSGSSSSSSAPSPTPSGSGGSATINGAGSTLAAPIYQQWGSNLSSKGLTVNYSAVGSGAGRSRSCRPARSTSPAAIPSLKPSEIAAAKGPVAQFPIGFGAVTVSYNLSGVKSGLKLDGPTVANIYLGKIKTLE